MRAEARSPAVGPSGGPGGRRWFKAGLGDRVNTAREGKRDQGARRGRGAGDFADSTWGLTVAPEHPWFEDSVAGAAYTVPVPSPVGRSLYRLFRTYVGARAIVGVLLATLHVGMAVAGNMPRPGALLISGVYAVQVLVVAAWLLGRQGGRKPVGLPNTRRIALTVGVDVLVYLLLLTIESSASFNFGALLVLPVLMAGVVLPRRPALATAAAVTLAILAEAWWISVEAPSRPSPWLASGLAGMGLFAIAWVSGELAARLLREERRATDSQERARQQASLNRLVIEEMGEGVLVLNRQRRVLAANPAARSLLGLSSLGEPQEAWAAPQAPWSPLLDAVERAHAEGGWPAAGRELSMTGGEVAAKLRARIRFTRLDAVRPPAGSQAAVADLCVVLLEDERAVQARVQQEKLAAMGRVSAGIAHEIRNPLAAIAQATELLAEDALAKPQDRLVSIIADNVQRLRRLIDDVLDALPSASAEGRPVEAAAIVKAVVADWAHTARVPPAVLDLALPPAGLQVLFDPEHLRRVLVNLLENAVRHSTACAGSVRIGLVEGGAGDALLTVSNDGPPVPPEVEIHMFEPFFSTRSRGSGLGLYICKELCERHGATIGLVRKAAQDDHHTAFEIRLRRPVADGLDGFDGTWDR